MGTSFEVTPLQEISVLQHDLDRVGDVHLFGLIYPVSGADHKPSPFVCTLGVYGIHRLHNLLRRRKVNT